MATLLFVHGTGVREKDYNKTYESVSAQIAKHLPGVKPQPCLWGKTLGADLHDDGASVPTYDATRVDPAGGQEAQRRNDEVRWRLLYQDPLYELRSLAAIAPLDEEGGAAAALAPEDLRKMLAATTFSPPVAEELRRAGHDVKTLVVRAADLLADDPVIDDALASPGLANKQQRGLPLARAFVAAWAVVAQEDALPTLGGSLRERMFTDVVAHVFGGPPKAISDVVGGVMKGLASWAALPFLKRKRTVLTDAAFPAAADILLYQARGAELRDFIARRIGQVDAPVYVMAHSLGGIATFELLAGAEAPEVAGLITVGSQAPLLYELDALATLRHDRKAPTADRLRKGFPRWLNVYDLNDMLSYLGAGVFPQRVADVEVASRQPFPQSHSAYWNSERLWTEVRTFMKGA